MDLFDKPVYLYGKVVKNKSKNKLVTPYKSFEIDLPQGLRADYLPVKEEGGRVCVFFPSKVFNSYILSVEENVKTLFSCDGKLTITQEEIEEGRVYTFIVDKEEDSLRRVSLFRFDSLYPGTKTKGRVFTRKNKYFVSTVYGEGELVLQNNFYGKKVEVLLYRKDNTLHFVQVDSPLETKIKVKVDSVALGYYTVSDRNIKGILFSKNKHTVGSTVEVFPRDNNLGFYIFEESKGEEVGRKSIKEDRSLAGEEKPSIPFDLPSEEEDDKEEDTNLEDDNLEDKNLNINLSLERKRSKFLNDDDFLMEIKAFPGKAYPLLKYFKYLVEHKREEEAVGLFFEYSSSLVGKERDDFSIAFVNYLIFTGSPDLFQIVKKLAQNCSMRFLDVVSTNSNDLRISKLYYSLFPNRNSYQRHLEGLFSSDTKEAYKLMEDNPKYLSLAIPLLYKFGDNQRTRIEKLISKNREAWFAYLAFETGEYKRHLFRRAVEYDWNKKDMKKFFKLWLEFETQEAGNVEEVRSRAKEYVERIKLKEGGQQ